VARLPVVERIAVRAHRSLYRRTNGRLGGRLRGASLLVLFTTGRRTGARRASVLVYIEDGDDLIIAATNRGRAHEPSWMVNLLAEPKVEVQLGRDCRPVIGALIKQDDAALPSLWRQVDEALHRWLDKYQRDAARAIRLVRLRRPSE
jgi:deazaflavin-dependent oxidoreductase (nitroreductase family)